MAITTFTTFTTFFAVARAHARTRDHARVLGKMSNPSDFLI
jgi:hypothetical protein